MKRLYVFLIAMSLFGCNQTSNPESEILQQAKVDLDTNVGMYSTVWNKS